MSITNHELQLANDFVQYTNCNIFSTGKAGTGKTIVKHGHEVVGKKEGEDLKGSSDSL